MIHPQSVKSNHLVCGNKLLVVEKPSRHDPDGRSVLDGSVLLRGWNGISEMIKKKSPGSGNSWDPMDISYIFII